MGHSEDMSKVYNHPNPADVKKMLREQVYNIEDLPPEKKKRGQPTMVSVTLKAQPIDLTALKESINAFSRVIKKFA